MQYEVGRLWQLNRVTVALEHFCTAVTQNIMLELYSKIISGKRVGKSVLSCCAGAELHEVGIRMVNDFFEMAGWDSYYLGAGVAPEQLIEAFCSRNPDLVAISATMTYHVPTVADLVRAVREADPSRRTRIVVGGAPFTRNPGLWRSVGADGWAPDAERAIKLAQELVALEQP
ncbi:hypothetical protein GMLC_39520 [Geomonas limicola]|uniref:B12-binding domain-containing protein n=1 Tax=Geomonas limicola TaxID=2740186 RepID=A0A6V8NFL4_9BACT|nr:hypothetical protein GMLC_39520 [Geomonas limicola]